MTLLPLQAPSRSKGFTLVEIAVVLGIGAMLVLLATFTASQRMKAARTNALVAEMNNIAEAANRAANLSQGTFTITSLVSDGLIKKAQNFLGYSYWLNFSGNNQTVTILTTVPKTAVLGDFPAPFSVTSSATPNCWQVSVETVLPRAAKGRSDNIFFGF